MLVVAGVPGPGSHSGYANFWMFLSTSLSFFKCGDHNNIALQSQGWA